MSSDDNTTIDITQIFDPGYIREHEAELITNYNMFSAALGVYFDSKQRRELFLTRCPELPSSIMNVLSSFFDLMKMRDRQILEITDYFHSLVEDNKKLKMELEELKIRSLGV